MATIKGGCFLINRQTRKIALVKRISLCDYSFPKGHMEDGEDVRECAIRETIEETGKNIKLLDDNPICINKYITSSGEEVEVYMYLAECLGDYDGIIAEKDREISEWYTIDEVEKKLSYDDLKALWNSVKKRVTLEMNKENQP